MSKGSSPRPYSVDQKTFDSNWDTIFKKNKGTCGCGRSPTGNCIGWHSLTEEQYQIQLENYMTNKTDMKGKPT
jgi:hypothetical protein